MPQFVYPAFKKLLLDLFLGTATRPANVYMGLAAGIASASDTMTSLTEIAGGGYARITIATSSLYDSTAGLDAVLTIPTQSFAAFTGTPTTNYATHWFLCSTLTGTGGSLYACGPLNPAVVSGALSAAAAAGQKIVLLPNSAASQIAQYDFINLGSVCAGDAELAEVNGIGTIAGSSTPITMVGNLSYTHPIGEAFNRDGATRTYATGYVEQVQAAIKLTQG